MDIGAFVQENKRWLIGSVVGALVWWIANSIVGSIYDADAAMRAQSGLRNSSANAEVYPRAALEAARIEAEQLEAERKRLQQELGFQQNAKFQLEGNGDPSQYLFSVGRALKQQLLDEANQRNIEVVDRDVTYPMPPGIDEIRGVLFGLELLDEFRSRLFAAHDQTRDAAPEAMAIRSIGHIKLDERRAQRAGPGPRRGEVDLRDLVVQERLTFLVEGDEGTLAAFLEACRKPGRSLVVETWTFSAPQRKGDPCQLKGTLLGIAFKPPAEENNG